MEGSIQLWRKSLAAQALVVTLYGGGQLALTLGSWLFVKFARTQFGQQTCFFHRALEATHCHFKRLILFNTYGRHEETTLSKNFEGAILAKLPPVPQPIFSGEFAGAKLVVLAIDVYLRVFFMFIPCLELR